MAMNMNCKSNIVDIQKFDKLNSKIGQDLIGLMPFEAKRKPRPTEQKAQEKKPTQIKETNEKPSPFICK